MFLAALEATAVAAAVPTAVGEMGGVSRYSWVNGVKPGHTRGAG